MSLVEKDMCPVDSAATAAAVTARDAAAAVTAPVTGMAALPPGRATQPQDAAQARARYFNSANAFNIHLDPVPARIFTAPAAVEAAQPATGYFPCDQSAALGCPWPATTPFMLARYACIAPGTSLAADFVASGSIWYVIAGRGQACSPGVAAPHETAAGTSVADAREASAGVAFAADRQGMHASAEGASLPGATSAGATDKRSGEILSWSRGDVFYLPAGAATLQADGPDAAVLWLVTDEPLLAYHGLRAARPDDAAVHFKAADITAEIERIHRSVPDAGTSGLAVVFSSAAMQARRNLMPALTLSLNTLPPGCAQSPHRHNSAALTLIVAGADCHSRVDGEDCPWSDWATLVTPAGAPHSHHNNGARRADFLIVQDGGLYYEARTMGFEFLGA